MKILSKILNKNASKNASSGERQDNLKQDNDTYKNQAANAENSTQNANQNTSEKKTQLQKSPKSTQLSHKRALGKIDEFAQNLGISEADKTILQVSACEDGAKKITLKKGRWDAPEPWFVIDESERVHTSVSIASLQNLLDSLRQMHRENFELRLEKAIYQQIPIDFNDAWIVAMDEIKKQAKGGLMEMNIDLDKLMSEVKRQHPNLFVDMEAMMQRGGFEG